jgi:cyclase
MLSRNFRLQKVGNLNWLRTNYKFSDILSAIDELVVLDVTREGKNSQDFGTMLQLLSERCFVPISAGGGIKSVEDARFLLRAGADKVVVNTALHNGDGFIEDLSSEFGQQCIVASIDIKQCADGEYQVLSDCGRNLVAKNAVECLADITGKPVGELYLNSIDRDGTGNGYDLGILDLLPMGIMQPVILAGGVGNCTHLAEGLHNEKVDAAATANLLNFVGDGLVLARNQLIREGLNLPIR